MGALAQLVSSSTGPLHAAHTTRANSEHLGARRTKSSGVERGPTASVTDAESVVILLVAGPCGLSVVARRRGVGVAVVHHGRIRRDTIARTTRRARRGARNAEPRTRMREAEVVA